MKQNGFNLIELALFLVILGILAISILTTADIAFQKQPTVQNEETATNLASKRMDIILGQRQIVGFSSFLDPCVASPSLPVCTNTTGYTTSSSIANNWNGSSSYKVITVTVSGLGSATLTSLVANY
jgi:type II secretory pathway pseudopilin PulG